MRGGDELCRRLGRCPRRERLCGWPGHRDVRSSIRSIPQRAGGTNCAGGWDGVCARDDSALGGSPVTAVGEIVGAVEEAGQLVAVQGTMPAAVEGVTDDSRAARAGIAFVAVRGTARDGHEFLPAV